MAAVPLSLLLAGCGAFSVLWQLPGPTPGWHAPLPARTRVPGSPLMDGVSATQPPQGISTDVAINGGDIWSGSRLSADEVSELCEEAMSRSISRPIMAQFRPERSWLWRQWSGTIVKAVLPREVFINMALAVLAVLIIQGGWPAAHLSGIERVWTLCTSLVSFTLSFFLNKAYTLWRSVYALTRRVQGRLNDICLLAAISAERDANGRYTPEAEALLRISSRYVRVFSLLLYASLTTKYAPLSTPGGLTALVKAEAITDEERSLLLETTTGTVGRGIMGHAAVLGWLAVLLERGMRDGTLGGSSGRSAIPLQHSFQNKVMDLRAAYGSIADELSGRMPLAYAQLVQILCDMLVLFSPVALVGSVGGWGAVIGTGCMTLFYSSVLKLAKMFLDPLDNEAYGGKYGISINVGTLLHETNIASERWSRGAARVPKGVLDLRRDVAAKGQPAALDDDDDDGITSRAAWQHAERARAAAAAAADGLDRQADAVERKAVPSEESDKLERRSSGAEEARAAEIEEQEPRRVAVGSADR